MDRIPVRHISATQKEPDTTALFNIWALDELLAGTDMVQELHRHDFFYILALKNGSGHHDIDFTHYQICDNTIFFMRPGQVHQLVLKAGSTGYLMQFSAGFYFLNDKAADHVLRKAGSINHYRPGDKGFQKLFNSLAYILQEYTDRHLYYQETIRANMDIFFIGLIRLQPANAVSSASMHTQAQLEKLLTLLDTHVFTHKQVAYYADMLNLSAYQLNIITTTTLGKTCSQVINEHIVLEAKRYLLATANQVNQIAGLLGYQDASYFIRFFKKHTGHSPEAFRHNFS
ncbi:helix-turn-helix domain-containing protein [Mucilaginibacter ginsenosidivorax]|uniref:Helix-turn-helix domain-containing protein n=1 Tax=Mucilaginibacter ginsenosidivorax TaxID=862126 RepID=A0A5B8W4G8_9SPHI|nr:helix-turn-helix domain-containing protein [Mucilaginibacter ginsenosidivorax]QEC78633.1 helix-turn-helix domain-containing protein [Mucilaginibacter ginsenosidivorax]